MTTPSDRLPPKTDIVDAIDLDLLKANGIRGIILDLDNTLVSEDDRYFSPGAEAWIQIAKLEGMKCFILSNGKRRDRVNHWSSRLGVPAISRARKPFPFAFRKAIDIMGLCPTQVVVIGDSRHTDMLGAWLIGCPSIQVASLPHPSRWWEHLLGQWVQISYPASLNLWLDKVIDPNITNQRTALLSVTNEVFEDYPTSRMADERLINQSFNQPFNQPFNQLSEQSPKQRVKESFEKSLGLSFEPHPSIQSRAKRCLDIVGALVGLVLTALLLIPIVIAIQLDNPGPVFYRQIRCGYRGKPFRLWKFRSMVANADQLKHLISNQAEGPIFKNEHDFRVTRVGKFLRRTSLDELPQFWNVLSGQMSLVGTRPPTLDEVKQYDVYHWQRLNVKPGLTGEWQVNGRSKILDFETIVYMDLQYQKRWSNAYDLSLILKTIRAIFTQAGAY